MARKSFLLAIALAILSGCALEQIPKEALEFSEDSAARRNMQTRRFETKDEARLLSASAVVLKELGCAIDYKSAELGLVAGSKQGSAYNVGEIAASVVLAVVTQVVGLPGSMAISKDQSLRASIVTRPEENAGGSAVRVKFQRVVWDSDGRVSRSELLEDPEAYRDFFARLSKAAGLEAHEP
jgi:hypothetical protein